MELNHTEAAIILQAHRIEVSDEDPRSPHAIATQYILTGSVALEGAHTATKNGSLPWQPTAE